MPDKIRIFILSYIELISKNIDRLSRYLDKLHWRFESEENKISAREYPE